MKVVVILTKRFFDGHPRAGEETHFADLVRDGKKIHTCRDNADYWCNKIERLKAAGGTLSIREWEGKPYRSRQITIADIPAEQVDVQRLTVQRAYVHILNSNAEPLVGYRATINDKLVPMKELATNDGFDRERDFEDFIDPLFDKYHSDTITLAVIYFNNYRYQ